MRPSLLIILGMIIAAPGLTQTPAKSQEQVKIDSLLGAAWAMGRSQPRQSIEVLEEVEALYPDQGDRYKEDVVLYYYGIFYKNLNRFDLSEEYFNRYEERQRAADRPRLVAAVNMAKANLYSDMGDFTRSMEAVLRALSSYESVGDTLGIIRTGSKLGDLLTEADRPDEAIAYLERSLELARASGELVQEQIVYTNLGVAFQKKKDLNVALSYYRRAYDIGEAKEGDYDKVLNRFNMANILCELGRWEEAIPFAASCAALADSIDILDLRAASRRLLADISLEKGQYQRAIALLQTQTDTAAYPLGLKDRSDVYGKLADAYERQGDYRRALESLQTFNTLIDSLNDLESRSRLNELSIQYETQQKEARIAQQELQLQKEVNRRNRFLFGGFAGLLLLGGLFGYFQNRSRQRQRQAEMDLQLKEAETEQLRKLDEFKSNFFANISHEFRTPLTLILGPLREMVAGTFKGDSKASQRMMLRNSERLLHLVNQLLELARLESGRASLDTRPLDLAGFLRPLVHSFESWAMRKQIYFSAQLPDGPLPVQADADKLEKIITNLLSNALKFTPEQGRVLVRADLHKLQGDQLELRFEVQDTGPGIAEGDLPHIFDRFYSPPREDREYAGSGIGLALTKELVELHGGRIEVESRKGEGSTFRVQWSLERAPLEAVQPASTPQQVTRPEAADPGTFHRTNSKKPLVLLVEDHPDLRSYIRNHLESDYQLVEAANGKQGLELATELIPDLVLTDVMMPEMDGLSLCEAIKTNEWSSHIPVIMLTALSEQGDKLSGLRTGADAYLTKPFDPEELQIMVKNLIEQRRLLRKKFAAGLQQREIRTQDFVSPAEESFLRKVNEIVEKNLDNEDFSIEELGRTVGMSRSQLHRKIKAITDLSPSVYVRTLRLRYAYQLLERKAGNISEVAFQVGIPNLAYFSRCFSDQFGFPPSELLHQ